MSIRRILVPVIVTLGVAGSILAGSVAPTVAAAPSAHAVAAAPASFYHG